MPPVPEGAIRRTSYLWAVTQLAERDYQTILPILAEAGTTAADDPLPVPLVDAIRRLFSAADTVAYFDGVPWDRARRRVVRSGGYLPWTPAESQLLDRLRFQLPLFPSVVTLGQAVRTTDVLPGRQYRQTDLYQLLGKRHSIEYTMDYRLRTPDGIVRGFSLDASRRDFSERDVAVLEVLGHHLARVLSRFDPGLPPPADRLGLTARQLEVLALVKLGQTNREIGERLSISAHTVRKHLENTYVALGVHNRAGSLGRVYGRSASSDVETRPGHAQVHRPDARPRYPGVHTA
jgi:DNA-binding NarL/FixJ family response regulator